MAESGTELYPMSYNALKSLQNNISWGLLILKPRMIKSRQINDNNNDNIHNNKIYEKNDTKLKRAKSFDA